MMYGSNEERLGALIVAIQSLVDRAKSPDRIVAMQTESGWVDIKTWAAEQLASKKAEPKPPIEGAIEKAIEDIAHAFNETTATMHPAQYGIMSKVLTGLVNRTLGEANMATFTSSGNVCQCPTCEETRKYINALKVKL